jgi:hypothetical protein
VRGHEFLEHLRHRTVIQRSFLTPKGIPMKFRTLILATTVLATASGYAFAQVPTERTGSKTEQGTQMQQDNKMGAGMKNNTTGSGMSGSNMGTGNGATSDKANGQMLNKNVSPASPDAGEKQQK